MAYRENGAIHRTPPRALTPLDELPDWPYQRLPMERYFHKHYLGDRVATHHSSFGCPFACNFCAVVGMSNRKWVAQSPDRVGAVLEKFSRLYGADAVQFHDMDFFISEARTQAIADRLTPLGMTWWALGRVDELMRYKDATWTAMKRSGLKMVFCGAESGSTEMLKRMNKGGTASADLTIELAARMKSHGIVPEFSFVVGNPPDPEADLAQTLSFIRRLKQVNDATEIILYVYSPVPMDGTFYDAAQRPGLQVSRHARRLGERSLADVRAAARSEHAVVARRSAAEGARLRKRVERLLPDRHRHANDAGAAAAAARRIGVAVSREGVHAAGRVEPAAARVPIPAAGDDRGSDACCDWPFARRRGVAVEELCGSIRSRRTDCGRTRIRRGRTTR